MTEEEATYLANDAEQTLLSDQNQGFTQEQLEKQKELDWKARELEAVQQGKRDAVANIIKEIEILKLDAEQITNAKAQLNSEFKRLSAMEEKNDHKLMTLQNTALKIITGGF